MNSNKRIPFLKMEGTGNDFIVIDNRAGILNPENPGMLASLCRRKKGIGADGIVLLVRGKKHPFGMRYFNADGHEAALCGNGARCLAWAIVHERWGGDFSEFFLESRDSVHKVQVSKNRVRLRMPQPCWVEKAPGLTPEGQFREWGWVMAGVPHYGIIADVENLDVQRWGDYFRGHERFPEGVNVDFIEPLSFSRLRVRTFERGVEAETLSCGTGAVAAAFMAHFHQKAKAGSPIEIETAGGMLKVHFDPDWRDVWLEGDVRLVFHGILEQGT